MRAPHVQITLEDGTIEHYEDVPYTVHDNTRHPGDTSGRPQTGYLSVTLPAERRREGFVTNPIAYRDPR